MIKTNTELVAKLIGIATKCKTLYVMGGIGYPLNAKGKQRAYKNSWNKTPDRVKFIEAATDDTFAFDCVCLIKSVLWGFIADPKALYGGAVYKANGVPDIGADSIINVCKEVSTNFSKIEVGELLWMQGHVGIYIGDGLAVECTPAWKNNVQITACNCKKSGYPTRNWKKHGKLPYIAYEKAENSVPETVKPSTPVANPTNTGKFKENDILDFVGTIHYASANARVGVNVPKSRVKVTKVFPNSKHPYHCRAVNNEGKFISGVYGWVSEEDLQMISTDYHIVQPKETLSQIAQHHKTNVRTLVKLNNISNPNIIRVGQKIKVR